MTPSLALEWWQTRGELRGPGDPAPRSVDGRPPAVLALHGFGGTPREVDLVVDAAAALGLRALAPLLPGHGTTVQELQHLRFGDWLACAHGALLDLTADGRPAIVVGLSLGSIIAAHLAATESRRVAGLGLLANAFWLSPLATAVLDVASAVGLPDVWIPKVGPDLRDPEARATHLAYGSQPLPAASEVLRGARATRERLAGITAPTLLVHGLRDRVCPSANVPRVEALLSGTQPRVLLLPRSGHVVTRDLERHLVRDAVSGLLQQIAADA